MTRREESITSRIRQVLGIGPTSAVRGSLESTAAVITNQLITEVSAPTPVLDRLQRLRDLQDVVLQRHIGIHVTQLLWEAVNDLIQPTVDKSTRHAVLIFLLNLIKGQYELLKGFRIQVFRTIHEYSISEDIDIRLNLLSVLTLEGKDIEYFEEQAGPLLLMLVGDVCEARRFDKFLRLTTNTFRFNAAYMNEEVIAGLVRHINTISSLTDREDDIKMCLEFIHEVLTRSYLPSEALESVCVMQCRVVNLPSLASDSWDLMRHLLRSHLGHKTLSSLTLLLQNRSNLKQPSMLRGAVYFVGNALWGRDRVQELLHKPITVLPAFVQAMKCHNVMVVQQVLLSVNRLLRKSSKDITEYVWSLVLDILEATTKFFAQRDVHIDKEGPNYLALVNEMEKLAYEKPFGGNIKRFIRIIEGCNGVHLPIESELLILKYKASLLNPEESNWIHKAETLCNKHFSIKCRDSSLPRRRVRLAVLEVMKNVLEENRYSYEDDIIEFIIRQQLSKIESDPDIEVRCTAMKLVGDALLKCNTTRAADLISILEKVVKRPPRSEKQLDRRTWLEADRKCSDGSSSPQDESSLLEHTLVAVESLISAFKAKLYCTPITYAARILNILVCEVYRHYTEGYRGPTAIHIRMLILELLLSLRSDNYYRLGVKSSENHTRFSPYAHIEFCEDEDSTSPGTPFATHQPIVIAYTELFPVFIKCLEVDKSLEAVKLVLRNLPGVLKNSALCVAAKDHMHTFVENTIALIEDKSIVQRFSQVEKVNLSECHLCALPVLAALIGCPSLPRLKSQQDKIVRCLLFGLVNRAAHVCVAALRLCLIEHGDLMMSHMSQVLLSMSKISPTVSMATCLIHFFSSLVHLPRVYANFTDDQYRIVFAVLLPYANPSNFSHYIVSMAYQVICLWFINSKPSSRRDLVSFIIKGLHSHLTIENVSAKAGSSAQQQQPAVNQDSCGRPRAVSLSTRLGTGERRENDGALYGSVEEYKQMTDEQRLRRFHHELIETCIDLLVTQIFSSTLTYPTRFGIADFLLDGGRSNTWMVGNRLITISVSGHDPSGQTSAGLCCQCTAHLLPDCSLPTLTSGSIRRRHASAAQPRTMVIPELSELRDDMNSQARRSRSSTTNSVNSSVGDPVANNELNVNRCWCSGWVEVKIRHPAGTSSWLVHSLSLSAAMNRPTELPLEHILCLLTQENNKSCSASSSHHSHSDKIEAGSLGEEEYGSLHDQHFMADSPNDMSSASQAQRAHPQGLGKVRKLSSSLPELPGGENVDETDINDVMDMTAIDEQTAASVHSSTSKPVTKSVSVLSNEDTSEDFTRKKRSQTVLGVPAIDLISPTDKQSLRTFAFPSCRGTSSPHNIFLQLFFNSFATSDSQRPILLPKSEKVQSDIRAIDHYHSADIHNIGVLYIAAGQEHDEVTILSNEFGSERYQKFIHGLGHLISIKNMKDLQLSSCGLDAEEDGKYTYVWISSFVQVVFHIATMMPNKVNDEKRTKKKLHIGNDCVVVVYNDTDQSYDMNNGLRTQFKFVNIEIRPQLHKSNRIVIHTVPELLNVIGPVDDYLVSDEQLPILIRIISLHANVYARVHLEKKRSPDFPYAWSWLNRLRSIKRLRARILHERTYTSDHQHDFTDYV